jgi:colicin import membrane protein
MRTRSHFCFVLLGVMLVDGVRASDANEQAQRTLIQRDRDAAHRQYEVRERACRDQFVVTPCIEKARGERHQALQILQAKEVLLDDAQRRRRSNERERRVQEKRDAVAGDSVPSASAGSAPAEPRTLRTPKARLRNAAEQPAPDAAARLETENRKRQAFDERQREIDSHRREVEKRNARKAAGATAKPLPLPDAASATKGIGDSSHLPR